MNGPTDTLVLATKLLAVFVGVALAEVLAPHIVIVASGLIGATFGLMAWRQCTRVEAVGYVLAFTGLAWLFAGSAAQAAADLWGLQEPAKLLAPSAAGIGWVGHRWPAVGRWGAGVLRRAIERRAGDDRREGGQ